MAMSLGSMRLGENVTHKGERNKTDTVGITRPVFRYFTPLGQRNVCPPPPLFVRIQLCSVKQ